MFEELRVPEGTGRLIVMQVYPGMPPYTDKKGRGAVRIGKECQPLKGSLRRKLAVETGDTDLTAETLSGDPLQYLSPSAMEQLRKAATRECAPKDILRMNDPDLLKSLQLIRQYFAPPTDLPQPLPGGRPDRLTAGQS